MQSASSLLSPFLHTSDQSLTLLTHILGTGSTWLVGQWVRQFYDETDTGNDGSNAKSRVVLFSFSRNWKEYKKKLAPPAGTAAELILLSGISTYLPPVTKKDEAAPSTEFRVPRASESGSKSAIQALFRFLDGHISKSSPSATTTVEDEASNSAPRTAVILEGLDLFLACLSDPENEDSQTLTLILLEELHSLRKTCTTVLISLSADSSLLSRPDYGFSSINRHLRVVVPSTSTRQEPLEILQTGLLLSLVHIADSVISLRLLGTGYAGDVSGVVACHSRADEDDGFELGKEFLYFLGANNAVKVWRRGAG